MARTYNVALKDEIQQLKRALMDAERECVHLEIGRARVAVAALLQFRAKLSTSSELIEETQDEAVDEACFDVLLNIINLLDAYIAEVKASGTA